MMPKPGPITFSAAGDRLFEYVDQFLILNAATAVGVLWASKQLGPGLSQVDYGQIDSQIFPLSLVVPFGGVLEDAMSERTATSRTLTIESGQKAPTMPDGAPFTQGFNGVLWHVITPIFVNFYERHLPWMEKNVGKQSAWPDTFYFARLIKNSISHGGKVHFTRDPKRTATWHHLRYDGGDHGKVMIGATGVFSISDLLFLMFDVSDELDGLGCPII
jgi:hypothetical protein